MSLLWNPLWRSWGGIALAVLTVMTVACLPNFSRAEMPGMPEHGCAGPACEQLACARADQATFSSKHPAEPLALPLPKIEVSPSHERTRAALPALPLLIGLQTVSPLAPRSPPAV